SPQMALALGRPETTREMMISSDPVVSAPEAADPSSSPSSPLASPDRTPLLSMDDEVEARPSQEDQKVEEGERERHDQKRNGLTNRGQEDNWEDIL
ncbi:hypothetical protein NHX12_032847, partial [Muraenolepis orangiensis]